VGAALVLVVVVTVVLVVMVVVVVVVVLVDVDVVVVVVVVVVVEVVEAGVVSCCPNIKLKIFTRSPYSVAMVVDSAGAAVVVSPSSKPPRTSIKNPLSSSLAWGCGREMEEVTRRQKVIAWNIM